MPYLAKMGSVRNYVIMYCVYIPYVGMLYIGIVATVGSTK
jgi:hypothetical protein